MRNLIGRTDHSHVACHNGRHGRSRLGRFFRRNRRRCKKVWRHRRDGLLGCAYGTATCRTAHFPTGIELSQALGIGFFLGKFDRIERNGRLRINRDQLLGQIQKRDPLTQILADLTFDLIGVGNKIVETAVFGNPLGRCFRPAFVDAGNVVNLVPHKRQIVNDTLGIHPVFLKDAFAIENRFGHRVDEMDVIAYQLSQILIARRNHDIPADGNGLYCKRAEYIVSFHTFDLQKRPSLQSDQLKNRFNLASQLLGHRRTIGFI